MGYYPRRHTPYRSSASVNQQNDVTSLSPRTLGVRATEVLGAELSAKAAALPIEYRNAKFLESDLTLMAPAVVETVLDIAFGPESTAFMGFTSFDRRFLMSVCDQMRGKADKKNFTAGSLLTPAQVGAVRKALKRNAAGVAAEITRLTATVPPRDEEAERRAADEAQLEADIATLERLMREDEEREREEDERWEREYNEAIQREERLEEERRCEQKMAMDKLAEGMSNMHGTPPAPISPAEAAKQMNQIAKGLASLLPPVQKQPPPTPAMPVPRVVVNGWTMNDIQALLQQDIDFVKSAASRLMSHAIAKTYLSSADMDALLRLSANPESFLYLNDARAVLLRHASLILNYLVTRPK